MKLGSEAAVGPGLITSLASPANTLIDAKLKVDKAAEDAAAKGADDLAKLTRTRQLLEERDKIAKLCVSLGIVCPVME